MANAYLMNWKNTYTIDFKTQYFSKELYTHKIAVESSSLFHLCIAALMSYKPFTQTEQMSFVYQAELRAMVVAT